MNSDFDQLSELQIDALREVANIGAGNSASTFAELFGDRIMISVPKVKIIPFEEVRERMVGAGSKRLAVNLNVEGEVPGELMLLFPWEEGVALAAILREEAKGSTAELSGWDRSMLAEIGKVVGDAYVQAIGEMMNLSLTAVFRDVSSGSRKDLSNRGFNYLSSRAGIVIFVETEFDGRSKKIKANLLFVPSGEFLEVMWQALGVH